MRLFRQRELWRVVEAGSALQRDVAAALKSNLALVGIYDFTVMSLEDIHSAEEHSR